MMIASYVCMNTYGCLDNLSCDYHESGLSMY